MVAIISKNFFWLHFWVFQHLIVKTNIAFWHEVDNTFRDNWLWFGQTFSSYRYAYDFQNLIFIDSYHLCVSFFKILPSWMTDCHLKLQVWFDDICRFAITILNLDFLPRWLHSLPWFLNHMYAAPPKHLIPTLSLSCEFQVHVSSCLLNISTWLIHWHLKLAHLNMQFCIITGIKIISLLRK